MPSTTIQLQSSHVLSSSDGNSTNSRLACLNPEGMKARQRL